MKKIVDSDYVSLKLSFSDVHSMSLINLLVIKKYLLSLKSLDHKCEKLEGNSKINAYIDKNINYYIGAKLFIDISQAVTDRDRLLLSKTLRLIKKETKRITELNHSINPNSIYNCTLNKEQAMAIMLEYMTTGEVCKAALRVYPDDVKSLVKTNN